MSELTVAIALKSKQAILSTVAVSILEKTYTTTTDVLFQLKESQSVLAKVGILLANVSLVVGAQTQTLKVEALASQIGK